MKIIIGLFALLLIIVGGGKMALDYLETNSFPLLTKKATAKINNHTFNLLIAKSAEEKEIGLSNKTSLGENEGMLFPFEKEDYYAFWMKEMRFPIDILYIRDNKIITLYQDVQPPKTQQENTPILHPEEPADAVLEINAGLSKKYGIKKGDSVTIEGL